MTNQKNLKLVITISKFHYGIIQWPLACGSNNNNNYIGPGQSSHACYSFVRPAIHQSAQKVTIWIHIEIRIRVYVWWSNERIRHIDLSGCWRRHKFIDFLLHVNLFRRKRSWTNQIGLNFHFIQCKTLIGIWSLLSRDPNLLCLIRDSNVSSSVLHDKCNI